MFVMRFLHSHCVLRGKSSILKAIFISEGDFICHIVVFLGGIWAAETPSIFLMILGAFFEFAHGFVTILICEICFFGEGSGGRSLPVKLRVWWAKPQFNWWMWGRSPLVKLGALGGGGPQLNLCVN